MQKDYYIAAYDELCDAAIAEADKYFDIQGTPKDRRDYGEWICEAEVYATTDEVVGYYLLTYPHDYKPMWDENTTGINLTEQDKEVSLILDKFWREEHGSQQDI
jgi:hypothetical protein